MHGPSKHHTVFSCAGGGDSNWCLSDDGMRGSCGKGLSHDPQETLGGYAAITERIVKSKTGQFSYLGLDLFVFKSGG